MLHTRIARFDVIDTITLFGKTFREIKKGAQAEKSDPSCTPRSPNAHFMCCPSFLSDEAIDASARAYASLRDYYLG